jgi:hypothetical protein
VNVTSFVRGQLKSSGLFGFVSTIAAVCIKADIRQESNDVVDEIMCCVTECKKLHQLQHACIYTIR